MENAVQKKILLALGVVMVAGVVFLLRIFTWRIEVEAMGARGSNGQKVLSGIEDRWKTIGASIDEARRAAKILKAPPVSAGEVRDLKNMIENSQNK